MSYGRFEAGGIRVIGSWCRGPVFSLGGECSSEAFGPFDSKFQAKKYPSSRTVSLKELRQFVGTLMVSQTKCGSFHFYHRFHSRSARVCP